MLGPNLELERGVIHGSGRVAPPPVLGQVRFVRVLLGVLRRSCSRWGMITQYAKREESCHVVHHTKLSNKYTKDARYVK